MRVCKVKGPAAKHERRVGHQILLVEPVNARGEATGPAFVAVDSVQAALDELVLVLREGLHEVIVGIVDGAEQAATRRVRAA